MDIDSTQALKQNSEIFHQRAWELVKKAKDAFSVSRILSPKIRNDILLTLSQKIREPQVQKKILEANTKDIKNASALQLAPSLLERLMLDEKRILALAKTLEEIVALPSPVGEVLLGKTLMNGIELIQKRVPIGVILTIYESRPNVTIDVGALCIKSGNVGILRGGKEALNTNLALYEIFCQVIEGYGLSKNILLFVNDPDREFLLAVLKQNSFIDLVVPRGGEALIQFVTENTNIPIIKHDKGVCTLYIDKSAHFENALRITINAKLQRSSVCNAIENLLIHKNFPDASTFLQKLHEAGVKLLGCERSCACSKCVTLIPKGQEEQEYAQEYLDERLSVKIVDDIQQAIDFIRTYTSGHSEAIVSNDEEAIQYFQENIDTASIFINCSTRFHDGGEMGFGSEIGISTGRLHVRGPMSLRDLTTTTYTFRGTGQVRG